MATQKPPANSGKLPPQTETERRMAAGETVTIGLITYGPSAPRGARDVVREEHGCSYRRPRG